MNKYLITGGEGFIGSKITIATHGISYDLKSGLDILNKKIFEDSIERLSGSEMDHDTFLGMELGIEMSCAGIFHCAAKISVPESMTLPEEYYRTNVEGTKIVKDVAEDKGCKIIFCSSAAVYGESSEVVKEESVLNPKSPYAENKRDGEEILKNSSVKNICLRYFNVYGPGQSPQYAGVITAFIMSALKNEGLVIYGDGNQVRDFVFVDDVVDANICAMNFNNKEFEIFNIGSGRETSINDLAKIIIKLTKSTSKIRYEDARAGDIVYSQADVSKAKRVLGWEAKVSLEDGLKKTIEYYLDK